MDGNALTQIVFATNMSLWHLLIGHCHRQFIQSQPDQQVWLPPKSHVILRIRVKAKFITAQKDSIVISNAKEQTHVITQRSIVHQVLSIVQSSVQEAPTWHRQEAVDTLRSTQPAPTVVT
eukprot:362326_1